MYVRNRGSTRHMKGKQVPLTLYLAPKKYWLLKWISDQSGLSMQHLVRSALEDVIDREYSRVERRSR
jgi:hypothetical protein